MGGGGGDDSFKKAGTVPFKWEVKPGVPKSPRDEPSGVDHTRSLPTTPRRLAPPPSADIGSQSFRSMSTLRSDRHRFDPKPKAPAALAHPLVVSAGCLLSPLFRRKWGRKKKVAHKASPDHEPDRGSLPRCSSSTRNSFSSRRSSSCQLPGRDPEWVGLGLF